jgi:hypothetical protein
MTWKRVQLWRDGALLWIAVKHMSNDMMPLLFCAAMQIAHILISTSAVLRPPLVQSFHAVQVLFLNLVLGTYLVQVLLA